MELCTNSYNRIKWPVYRVPMKRVKERSCIDYSLSKCIVAIYHGLDISVLIRIHMYVLRCIYVCTTDDTATELNDF